MFFRRVALLFFVGAAFSTGCQTPGGAAKPENTSPVLDRLKKTYSDLESGRFLILADFEPPGQAELFRIIDADGGAGDREQPAIAAGRGKPETGTGALRAVLREGNDLLLFDGRRSPDAPYIRDWREYSVLLMNICGPPEGAVLEFTAQSGGEAPLRWTRTLQAEPGWRLYRFDLAEIGEQIDLSDVRALSWRAPQIRQPVEIFLDDLILADNARLIAGDPATTERLYVLTRGRRLHVGVRNRFELAFCDGLITAWHPAGHLENLVVPSGLGPWPVPLGEDWADPDQAPPAYDDPQFYAHWGLMVDTRQRLVEMSPLRVVVEGIWRFRNAPPEKAGESAGNSAGNETVPSHRWQYAIYPSGQVYVQITSSPGGAGWPLPLVGYAAALDGRRGFKRIKPAALGVRQEGTGFVLLARTGGDGADFLWVPRDAALAARQLEVVSEDERRLAVILGGMDARKTVQTAHLLRFFPLHLDTAAKAAPYAADYQNPTVLKLAVGHAVTDAPGDANRDGYNEAEGCYELAADAGVLRFAFNPGERPRHDPAFRVRGLPGARCWVYADGRIVKTCDRDAQGNWLFVIPGPVSSPMTIEASAAPSAARP